MASRRASGAGSAPLFESYRPPAGVFDEFFEREGVPRPEVADVVGLLDALGTREFRARHKLADAEFFKRGVTFAVYSDDRGTEKIFPFDLVPRIVSATAWDAVDRGLKQRVTALNCFLEDIYGAQRVVRERIVPRYMIRGAKGFCPQAVGVKPPKGIYIHIAGIDLVRAPNGEFLVLEDNVRTPSGVSYVLENRMALKKVYPHIFGRARARSVDEYPTKLREALAATSPGGGNAHAVVLTPGAYNSAYFEHSFLARRMGVDLVEGRDLFVNRGRVYARTTKGPTQVDVIYRRLDDPFLDPQVFRSDSMLGVPGLFEVYAKGRVTLANAVGNGIADDKAIYPYVPDMIRFYLSEEPILGPVPTYICAKKADLAYVVENVDKLVVKSVNEAGGYGMIVGPKATKRECSEFARKIADNPRNFIAQPLVELSTCPTWISGKRAARRGAWRPYDVAGFDSWVLPGGLTRVALRRGSYVVNSSQGGGSKDTWVLEAQGK